jgi:hypothetical protein
MRIYTQVDESILERIDKTEKSRSQFLTDAINSYLILNGSNPELLRSEMDHLRSTIDAKDKQISFLEGHVSQLTQSLSQLALTQKTDEEKAEIKEKKKPRWKFWWNDQAESWING